MLYRLEVPRRVKFGCQTLSSFGFVTVFLAALAQHIFQGHHIRFISHAALPKRFFFRFPPPPPPV